jgi:hypothetical protein
MSRLRLSLIPDRSQIDTNKGIIQRALKLLNAPISRAWLVAQKDCAEILSTQKQMTLISKLFIEQESLVRNMILESQEIILKHLSSSIGQVQFQAPKSSQQLAIEDKRNDMVELQVIVANDQQETANPQVVASLTQPPQKIDDEDDDESLIYGKQYVVQPPTQLEQELAPPELFEPIETVPQDIQSPQSQYMPQTLHRMTRCADKKLTEDERVDDTEAIPSSSLIELMKDDEASLIAKGQGEFEFENEYPLSRERESVFSQAYQSVDKQPQKRLPHTTLQTKSTKAAKERGLRGITLAKRSSLKRDLVDTEKDDNTHALTHAPRIPKFKKPKKTLYITDEPSAPDDTPMREAKNVLKALQEHDMVMSIMSFPTAMSAAEGVNNDATAQGAAAAFKEGITRARVLSRGGKTCQEEEAEDVHALDFSEDAQMENEADNHKAKRKLLPSKFQTFQEEARLAVAARTFGATNPPPILQETARKRAVAPKTPAPSRGANKGGGGIKEAFTTHQKRPSTVPLAPPPPRTTSFTASKRLRPGSAAQVPSLVSRAFSAKDARPLFEALRGDPISLLRKEVPRFKPGFNANTLVPPAPIRMADGRVVLVAENVADIFSGTTTSSINAAPPTSSSLDLIKKEVQNNPVEQEQLSLPRPSELVEEVYSASTAIPESEENIIDSGVLQAALLLDGGIHWSAGGEGGGGGGGGDDERGRLSMPTIHGRSTAVAAAGLAWMQEADEEHENLAWDELPEIPPELLAAIINDHRDSGRASMQPVEDVPLFEFSPDVGVSAHYVNESDFVSEDEGENINYDDEDELMLPPTHDSPSPLRIIVDPDDEYLIKQAKSKSQGGGGGGGGGGGRIVFSAEDLIED